MIERLYRKALGVDKVSRTFKFKVHVALTFAFLLGIFALIVWGIFTSPRWSTFVAFVGVTGMTCILMKKVWDEYKLVDLAAKVFGNTADNDDAASNRSSIHFQNASSRIHPTPKGGPPDFEPSVPAGTTVVISTVPLHTIEEDDDPYDPYGDLTSGSDNDDDIEIHV